MRTPGVVLIACALALPASASQSPVRQPAPARKAPPSPPASIGDLEAAVKRDPGNAKLLVALGLAYWDQNQEDKALETFRTAVKVAPRSAEARNWLGVALSGKADLPNAIVELKKAVELDPKYGRAYTNLGAALAKSGDFTAAVGAFQKALALEPNNLAAHTNLGLALREKGDLDAALVHLRRVAARDPDNAAIQYELGLTLRQRGDLTEAVTTLERALDLDPEMREGYYALGMALKQQAAAARKAAPTSSSPADAHLARGQEALTRGDVDGARDELAAAVSADDTNAEAHNLLGYVLGQRRELAVAIDQLQRAIALRPEYPDAHYNLGVALWYSGRKDDAIRELRVSLQQDPSLGASCAFLGSALKDQGDLPGARRSLQHAIALLPPTPAIYVDLGIVFLRGNDLARGAGQLEAALNVTGAALPAPDWDAAVASLRPLLAANPDSAEGHNVLGLLLGRRGASAEDVAAQFREAIRLRPDYAAAHNNLGLVLLQSGDDAAAIAALREAVRLRPDYADAHDNLGAALTPTDVNEAIRELELALKLAPNSVKAMYNLAIAYGASPDRGPAAEIEQLRTVIALEPSFARAHLAIGKALLQDGKVPEAIDALQQAARLDPENGEAHYQLGLALARSGRKDEASAELQKGRELVAASDRAQNAGLDLAEGRVALQKGNLEEAVSKFRRAVQAQPDSVEAKQLLDEALAKQRKPDPGAAADVATREADIENFIRQERYVEVEPLLAEYVTAHPTSSWGWYALGYSQFAQKKIGESIKSLAKSLQLDIKNAEAHKILGRSLMTIGRFDAAQLEFEQGIRYKPDSAEIHYNLGKLLSIQDNWEPARKHFEAALAIDPSYLEALDALGLTQEALGDDAAAVASYEKAITLNQQRSGHFASAHVNLSAYYNRTGDAVKALEYAKKAVELDPQSDRAYFQQGRAEERQGQLDAAVAALNQAIVLNPRASSYYYVLAGVYRRLGMMDESKKALDMFTRLDKETTAMDQMRRRGAEAAAPAATPR